MSNEDNKLGVKMPRNLGQIFLQSQADLSKQMRELTKPIEVPRNLGQIFLQQQAELSRQMREVAKSIKIPTISGQIFIQQQADLSKQMRELTKPIGIPRNLGQIFLQQQEELSRQLRELTKPKEATIGLGQIFLQQQKDLSKQMRELTKPLQELNMEPLQKIAVMDSTLSSSLNQMDGVSSMQYYEELSSVIRENNLNEVLIEEDNPINVISDNKLKSLCYRLAMGLAVMVMFSTLTGPEIKEVLNWIGWFIGVAGGMKTLMQTPEQEQPHRHND